MTVTEIIEVAKVSQYLSANEIQKKGLFGGGIDGLLPTKIYNIRKSVEWLNTLDNTDTTLVATANYLLSLCGMYALEAENIIGIGGGGSIAPVTPVVTPTAPDVETADNIANVGQVLRILASDGNYYDVQVVTTTP